MLYHALFFLGALSQVVFLLRERQQFRVLPVLAIIFLGIVLVSPLVFPTEAASSLTLLTLTVVVLAGGLLPVYAPERFFHALEEDTIISLSIIFLYTLAAYYESRSMVLYCLGGIPLAWSLYASLSRIPHPPLTKIIAQLWILVVSVVILPPVLIESGLLDFVANGAPLSVQTASGWVEAFLSGVIVVQFVGTLCATYLLFSFLFTVIDSRTNLRMPEQFMESQASFFNTTLTGLMFASLFLLNYHYRVVSHSLLICFALVFSLDRSMLRPVAADKYIAPFLKG